MADTLKYYLSNDITAYPCSNATDNGKLNLEDNMSSIVTRITERNYALSSDSFELSVISSDSGNTINITSGQANIRGYHIITTSALQLPPPQAAGTDYAICFKLARDSSDHVLGDVYDPNEGTDLFNGLWVSYFGLEEAKADPDILIIGTVDWDGSNFSNLEKNPDILSRLDASTIIININDPKHPDYTTITLQELTDNLKDWYVSKDGDDEYGTILFKTSRQDKSYGISIGAIDQNNSEILIKPISSNELATQLRLGANSTNPYIKLASSTISTTDDNLLIDSTQDTTISSDRNILLMAGTSTTINTDEEHTMEAIVNKDNVIFQKDLNTSSHKFDIDDSGLYYNLGSLKLSYINATNTATIDGVTRVTIAPDTTFSNNATVTNRLDIGTNSKTYITNTQFVLENGVKSTIDGTGMKIEQNGSSTTPSLSISNTNSSLRTNITPSLIQVTGSSAGIEFIHGTLGTVSLKRSNNDNTLNLTGNLNATGDITARRVYNAVYNDGIEFMEKEDYKEDINPGDVVCFTESGKVTKVKKEEDIYRLAGVVSSKETYGFVLGGDGLDEDQKVPVALFGRVYVNVKNLSVKVGDLLAVNSSGEIEISKDDNRFVIGIATKSSENGFVYIKIK